MSILWDKRNQRWRYYFDRVIEGQRQRATKLLPKGWSKTRAGKYELDKTGTLFAQGTGQEAKDHSISDAVKLYLDLKCPTLRNGKKAAHDLAHVIPWFQGKPLSKLPEVARDYMNAHTHLAPATVPNRLAYLRAACRYAFRQHGLGAHDPAERMMTPRVSNERHEYITPKQLNTILAKIKEVEVKAIFRIAFYTGMRWRSEVLILKRENIIDGWFTIKKTKTDKPKMVPIHKAIKRDLKFIPFKFKDRYYYDRYKRAAREVGLWNLVAHDLRHSLASNLISKGTTLYEVGGILGHKSPQSTKRYAHLYPARMKYVLSRAG